MNIDALLNQCAVFMADHPNRLNERERRALDRIIESYETTRKLSGSDVSFLNAIYRRTKLDEKTGPKETSEPNRRSPKLSDGTP